MLEVKGLSTYYYPEDKTVKAVGNVSFSVGKGEIVGLLGESGSGKSTIAHSILRLVDHPGKIVAGKIIFGGHDLLELPETEMIKIRGAKISMIFQDPFTSLNPVFSIGDQIAEVLQLHQGLNRRDAWQKAVEMLGLVRVQDPGGRARDYPHQFSGGMRQRAMIAMALACQPDLLIADEPTTALDVTIQAEIIKLLKELQQKLGLSIIYITHNFGIIKALCQRVLVLYKGSIVEEGTVGSVLSSPQNSYTVKLIDCLRVLRK
ncbi:MAG: ABC transporter ATP-binding protein [Candidatus Margulisbacteria bacterium]|nr:ABC transporter ATP-binding protein [Candidatus Margulisiibacteriota bacterium]